MGYLRNKDKTVNGIIAGGIVLISYFLRLIDAIYYQALSRDSYTYLNIIERNEAISDIDYQEAVYPLFIFLFRLPTHFNLNTVYACRALNILLGTLTVYSIILLAKQISPKRIVWVSSGLIAATYPNLVHYSTQVQRESFYLFLLSLVMLFTVKYIKRNRRKQIVIISFLTGCIMLTRHEAIEIIPFVLLAVFFANKEKKILYSFQCASVFLALTALSILFLLLITDSSHVYLHTLFSRLYKTALTI